MREAKREHIENTIRTIKLGLLLCLIDVKYVTSAIILETRFVLEDFLYMLSIARELNRYERRVIRMRRKIDPWNSFKVTVLTWLVGGVVICGVVLAFGVST